jgi:hypothetical protein
MALQFTLKGILRQKKNYKNSNNISLCEKYNLQKILLKKNENPSRYYSTITNLKFQRKPKYHISNLIPI